MDDTRQQALSFLLETMKETKELVVEQAPLIIKEMLEFALIETTVGFIVSLLVTTVTVYITTRLFIEAKKDSDKYPAACSLTVLVLICSGFCIEQGLKLYKIKYTPRAYILEELKRF